MRAANRKRCQTLLRTVFGKERFRPGQEEAVSTLLRGQDLFCLFPTGAGKSICYQLPALLMDGPALVLSPLIALMRDQAGRLQELGVEAVCLDSLQTQEQFEQSMRQAETAQLIYLSPERLQSARFQKLCMARPPALAVVDEAHCVTDWGKEFRPAYREIGPFLKKLPRRPVICAMTATATARMRGEIARSLGMSKWRTVVLPLVRENLSYSVWTTTDPDRKIAVFAAEHSDVKGLVFCRTRKRAEKLAAMLDGQTSNGKTLRAGCYHAGLERAERERIQTAYAEGKIDLLAVTSAFGMGIDIPDIRYVIHDRLPDNVTDLAQQSGRAGRDGLLAACILLLDPADLEWHRMSEARERLETKKARFSLRKKLELRRKEKAFQEVLTLCLDGQCIQQHIGAHFGQKNKPCFACSACRRLTENGRRSPLASVPDLKSVSAEALRRWALAWQVRAYADSHQLRPAEVMNAEALNRSALTASIRSGDCLPAAQKDLARLLSHMRVGTHQEHGM